MFPTDLPRLEHDPRRGIAFVKFTVVSFKGRAVV